MEQGMNKAWDYLRANFKPDGKGRHKTVHAMEVAKHFASENDRLVSGPGGIMEMKQTIADKEAEIEQLQNDLNLVYAHDSNLLDSLKGWK
jgi:hypothetical protein